VADLTAQTDIYARVSQAMARSRVLHRLSEAAVLRLAKAGAPHVLSPGETLIHAGDTGDAVFIVLEGSIEVLRRSRGGRDVRLAELGAGAIVGEMAALDGGPRSADMVASRRSRLWRIPRSALLEVLEQEPKCAIDLMAELARRLRDTNAALEAMELLDLAGRLAQLLMNERNQSDIISLTQTEIARRLGASREKVNRRLHQWAQENVVVLDQAGIRLKDPRRRAALIEEGLAR
jgi:CRP/FNR family transcriptional regulator, cyclic AMP receptor protein